MIALQSFLNILLSFNKWRSAHYVFTRSHQFLFLDEYIYITHVQKIKWTRNSFIYISYLLTSRRKASAIFITFPGCLGWRKIQNGLFKCYMTFSKIAWCGGHLFNAVTILQQRTLQSTSSAITILSLFSVLNVLCEVNDCAFGTQLNEALGWLWPSDGFSTDWKCQNMLSYTS